ncbi:hypothetical protein SKAU_G00207050 [Synaphobranchus kaupii]|uniref:Uncharacterized protein n=1 Tax=Synaphobranchus kaupii TaxID=118154 RepID=A0A9Q1F835_SYNKA|nr:hypothetical protein SKAU_G00207050 [Synaphobranchus kaupii]
MLMTLVMIVKVTERTTPLVIVGFANQSGAERSATAGTITYRLKATRPESQFHVLLLGWHAEPSRLQLHKG